MAVDVINQSTQEVFNHHMDAFLRRDLADLASDFHEQSILIASMGIKVVGIEAVKEVYKGFFESLEEGTSFTTKQVVVEGDIVFLEWTAESASSSINDGVDTFVIRDGKIHAQTAKFNFTPVNS
jgi:ketosteroid isomerase-like protein